MKAGPWAIGRRGFLGAAGALAAGFVGAPGSFAQSTPAGGGARPQVALTIDDPTVQPAGMPWPEINRRVLDVLRARRLQAALFVCGMRVDEPDGRTLLQAWDDAGHQLGSHSYSHRIYLKRTDYDTFAADFLRNEAIVAPYRNRVRLFRYPALKEGDTVEKRDRFRALLTEREYRVGHVTIDASDWYVESRLQQRRRERPSASTEPYRDYLIAHLLDRAAFYRQLAIDAVGRDIRHTLLVHYNSLLALHLEEVLAAFERAGWQWIDAPRAYEDEVFARAPKTVPAGESLAWALASERAGFAQRLRWPGEDGVYEERPMTERGL